MWQLYAVAITAGVCTVFFDVSYQSYLPWPSLEGTTGGRQRQAGRNSVVGSLIGPSLGAGLVGLVRAARAMAADAISYAVSVSRSR